MNTFNKKNFDQKNKEDNTKHWLEQFTKDWITKGLGEKFNGKDAIDFADKFGEAIADQKFTTNQIRNFFGEVRRIEMKGIEKEKTAFLLLQPKLSYAVKRQGNKGADLFEKVILEAHKAVKEVQNDTAEFTRRFKNFIDFLEAILAYHKVHGGK